jgi:hypothetical protein
MEKIKSFIYLDEYKMYSFSSQLFNGLTEALIEYHENDGLDQETQKGPIGSGKVLSDIIRRSEGKQEIRFLHDYAYSLFEKKLIEDGRLSIIKNDLSDEFFDNKKSFMKITGSLKFKDAQKTINTFREFNKIGGALAYLSSYASLEQLRQTEKAKIDAISDRNEKSKLQVKLDNTIKQTMKASIEEAGLHFDEKFLENMIYVLEYGYKDAFEIEMPATINDTQVLISAFFNREYLREDEDLIIEKYSRATEKAITIVGIITQYIGHSATIPTKNSELSPQTIKQSMSQMTDQLVNIEESMIGKAENEIIIDPIALYLEV